ncbi:MAG: DUF4388 domain-containing protein [Pyrinomonadaceae bacterium]
MAFTGQMNDLALSELIEFFCNQRKTGRLKVDYPLAPGVFFIKEGDLVDAKFGALNGVEAVFFALTLPSASFDFSAGMQSSRRTISESWASVVLEGLRRLDEGIVPDASKAFATEEEIDEATIEYLNCIEDANKSLATPVSDDAPEDVLKDVSKGVTKNAVDDSPHDSSPLPLSQTLAATSNGGRGKLVAASVVASVVLICAVAAIPLSKRFKGSSAPVSSAPAATQAADSNAATQGDDSADQATPAPTEAAPAAATMPTAADAAAGEAAALAARRAHEARQERARKLLEAKRTEAAQAANDDTATGPSPAAKSTGAKAVRVSITYDEAGRVTQASAVGSSPGAEAYASTAVRVARGRRFPAGKAGSTIVVIPIN